MLGEFSCGLLGCVLNRIAEIYPFRANEYLAWRANLLEIADERAPLNLQVEYFIDYSGGSMVPDLDELIALVKSKHREC